MIDELRHPGAALLLGLLDAEQTEDDLRQYAPNLSQSAINRKLQRLAESHIIRRETGSKQQKGLRWKLAFREETHDLLSAANRLVQRAIDEREDEVADTALRLRRTRPRAYLRDVSEASGD